MLNNTTAGWGLLSRLFHWVCAAVILFLLAHGAWMTEFAPRESRLLHYATHAEWGYALLCLMVLRLLWRWASVVPALPAESKPWERMAAHISHWGLYALILAAALSGWALAGTGRRPFDMMFGLQIPALATDRSLHRPLEEAHEVLAWTLAALVVIHVIGAFYHLIVKKDSIMRRMLVSVQP